jgi:hypothetical protein
MGTKTSEIVMPGDRDYIEQGIKEAALYADGEAALDAQETPDIFDDDAKELWPKRGGGEYGARDVGGIRFMAGRAGVSSVFSPEFSSGHINLRRHDMLRTVGHVVIFNPPPSAR